MCHSGPTIVGYRLRSWDWFVPKVRWVSERKPSFSDSAIQRAFGDRVRALRAEKGWTQEQLVDRTGLDRAYLSEVENGHRNPSLLTVARIAGAFGIEISELFTPR
jgi:DNA-binding XRE family transcriptional regulator